MKYKRMLCWIRHYEREEIESSIHDIPLEFVDTLTEFESKITEDSYPVVSLSFINNDFKKFANKFPNTVFNLYRLRADEEQTVEQSLIMGSGNITNGQYEAHELRDNYLGVIEDLWKYRLLENPTTVNS
jgi:hypothetical protein